MAPHSIVGILAINFSRRFTRKTESPERADGLYTTQIFILERTVSTNAFMSSIEIPVCSRSASGARGDSPNSRANPFAKESIASDSEPTLYCTD